MRIDVKGRHREVPDSLRVHVERRFEKVARQVSDLAQLEVEISEEHNPAIAEPQVVEATLFLKGTTLRASDRARDPLHAVNLVADELARQVKRHRDKRRARRESRAPVAGDVPQGPDAGPASDEAEG